MSDAARFQALAKQYRDLASTASDPVAVAHHLKLASTWENYALQAERRAAKPAVERRNDVRDRGAD